MTSPPVPKDGNRIPGSADAPHPAHHTSGADRAEPTCPFRTEHDHKKNRDMFYLSITAHPKYVHRSFEELRWMYQEGEMANSNIAFHVYMGFGSENLAGCVRKLVLGPRKLFDTVLKLHPSSLPTITRDTRNSKSSKLLSNFTKGAGVYMCHKVIIAARAPKFFERFATGTPERRESEGDGGPGHFDSMQVDDNMDEEGGLDADNFQDHEHMEIIHLTKDVEWRFFELFLYYVYFDSGATDLSDFTNQQLLSVVKLCNDIGALGMCSVCVGELGSRLRSGKQAFLQKRKARHPVDPLKITMGDIREGSPVVGTPMTETTACDHPREYDLKFNTPALNYTTRVFENTIEPILDQTTSTESQKGFVRMSLGAVSETTHLDINPCDSEQKIAEAEGADDSSPNTSMGVKALIENQFESEALAFWNPIQLIRMTSDWNIDVLQDVLINAHIVRDMNRKGDEDDSDLSDEILSHLPKKVLTKLVRLQKSVLRNKNLADFFPKSRTLGEDLRELYEMENKEGADDSFADFQIEVDDKVFLCHKVILRSRSRFFESKFMFEDSEPFPTKKKTRDYIKIVDFEADAISALLAWMYSDQVKIDTVIARKLLGVTSYFQLPTSRLEQSCVSKLISTCTPVTLEQTLRAARKAKATQMCLFLGEIIREYDQELIDELTDSFDRDLLRALISIVLRPDSDRPMYYEVKRPVHDEKSTSGHFQLSDALEFQYISEDQIMMDSYLTMKSSAGAKKFWQSGNVLACKGDFLYIEYGPKKTRKWIRGERDGMPSSRVKIKERTETHK